MKAERLSVTEKVCLNCKKWKTYGSVCNPFGDDPATHSCSGHLFDREDLLRRASAIESENADLRAQIAQLSEARRVVPELTEAEISARFWGNIPDSDETWYKRALRDYRWAYNLAVSRLQSIPATQVLKDGEEAIGFYEMQMLRDFAARRMSQREYDRLEACRDAHEAELRSATGGV